VTKLRGALVSDALDSLGLRAQSLRAGIVPLTPGTAVAGPAFPLEVTVVDAPPEVPYRGLLRALDAVPRDAVVVASAMGREDVAIWGELLSSICIARAAAGVVCDGNIRDVGELRGLGFPIFARGTIPTDINGRLEVTGPAESITAAGVLVTTGDLVVADDDGVVVVPAAVAEETVARALNKASGESEFRDAIEAGLSATEAFAKFGVL
jgi:4-hydroxy-4-methyl-2-oxoglutarate aldolase